MQLIYPCRIFIVLLLLLIEFANGFTSFSFSSIVQNEMEKYPAAKSCIFFFEVFLFSFFLFLPFFQ